MIILPQTALRQDELLREFSGKLRSDISSRILQRQSLDRSGLGCC